MHKLLLSLILGLSVIIADAATVATPPPASIVSNIKNNLKTTLPEIKVDQVNTSVIPGMYEVISGHKVFYVDSSGRYAMLGNLVDLNTKQSLTEQKVKSLDFVNWANLQTNIALQQVKGKGERKIAVFLDPECPFCKELEIETIAKLKNVTVYYYLFPLAIHANAVSESQRILCSENPDRALINWLKKDQALPGRTKCKNADKLPIMQQIGREVAGVDSTPTIVLPNGKMVEGLVPLDYLNQLINQAEAPVTSTPPTNSSANANAKLSMK